MSRVINGFTCLIMLDGGAAACQTYLTTSSDLAGNPVTTNGTQVNLGTALGGAVQSAGGNASSTIVSNRSASSRASDQTTILDLLPAGTTIGTGSNDTQNVQNAVAYASTNKQNGGQSVARLLVFNPGSYNIPSNVYDQGGTAVMMPQQAIVSGGGGIPGIVNLRELDGNVGLTIGKVYNANGGKATMYISGQNNSSNGAAAYEHDALYVDLAQGDDSGPSGGTYTARDGVALHLNAMIQPGLTLGRVWGSEINVETNGSDGYLVGAEVGLSNNAGVAAGGRGSYTSKFGLNLFALGNADSTAAINIGGNPPTSHWQDGISAYSAGLKNNFLRLDNGTFDVFHVTLAGDELSNSVTTKSVTLAGGSKLTNLLYGMATSSTAPVILTSNGGTLSTSNCVLIPFNNVGVVFINAVMREPATGQWATWNAVNGSLSSGSTAQSIAYGGTGSSSLAPTYSLGTNGAAARIAISTDNGAGGTGCLRIVGTPPSSSAENFRADVSVTLTP